MRADTAEQFNALLKSYQDFLDAQPDLTVDRLRIETQVESLRDWSLVHSLDEFAQWYLAQQENCSMQVTDIALNECRGWHIDEEKGDVTHESGEFFKVQGVRVSMSQDREVGEGGWDQPMVTQVGFVGGLLGLLRKRIDGIPHYLVEAKAEPGNPDLVQISPTLQATFSNLKRAHGGNKPRFAELFEEPEEYNALVLFRQWMSEDGGRLHLKKNMGMLVEVDDDYPIPDDMPTFTWASLYQLKALLKNQSWVNPHIRGIISHL
jgi:oxidase EvaA